MNADKHGKGKASLILALSLLSACAPAAAPTTAPGAATLTVTSSAFAEGGSIPQKYTCQGQNVSPELKWSGAPAATQSYALIMDDPDAPIGTFTHWVAYDIPASQTEIAEGVGTAGKSGKNGTGKPGFTGPCPPSGTHRYFFTLYALDVPNLGLAESAARDEVIKAVQGHILAQGRLMGKYGK